MFVSGFLSIPPPGVDAIVAAGGCGREAVALKHVLHLAPRPHEEASAPDRQAVAQSIAHGELLHARHWKKEERREQGQENPESQAYPETIQALHLRQRDRVLKVSK